MDSQSRASRTEQFGGLMGELANREGYKKSAKEGQRILVMTEEENLKRNNPICKVNKTSTQWCEIL
jgi:hypothetical protein